MKVIKAQTAGFCFGVKRAVDQVYDLAAKEKEPVYTYGPIIHNEEVVRDLEEKGVRVLNGKEDLLSVKKGTVVIRSHGVGKEIYDLLNEHHITVVDATCPFVKKIHRIVEEQTREGRRVIIIGNPDHPEVQGIRGWGNDTTLVVENADQIEHLSVSKEEKMCIVSQTTFNYKKFQDLVEILNKKGYDIVEARRIASEVDAMIVIGGKHSSNTQKLYEICQKECKNTYFIQSLGDFNPECVNSVRSVGITAGASTPNQIIEEVHTNVRIKF